MIVMLDTGPLGLVTNPRATPRTIHAKEWLVSLFRGSAHVALPEIADYEVRRELLRATKVRGLRRLDGLKSLTLYVPLTTEMMLRAAVFWARLRQAGRPTADPHDLDCDVILAAQAAVLGEQMDEAVLIATTNVSHLSGLAVAREWQEIDPAEFG